MDYLTPIIFSLVAIFLLVGVILFSNGVIRFPKSETAPVSNYTEIEKILNELNGMSYYEIQELKFKLENIFLKPNILMPILP